jgi:hypothetical protein
MDNSPEDNRVLMPLARYGSFRVVLTTTSRLSIDEAACIIYGSLPTRAVTCRKRYCNYGERCGLFKPSGNIPLRDGCEPLVYCLVICLNMVVRVRSA